MPSEITTTRRWRPNWPMLATTAVGVAFNVITQEWRAAIIIAVVGAVGQLGVMREGISHAD